MFPTNPAVTDGVEIFVWIVVVLINAIILITVGGWGYFESGSPTSLIPVFIGSVLVY